MSLRRPRFLLLGGPNGSGKSTIAPYLVRDIWRIERFLNADTIARGLAGFNPDLALISAGRTLLVEAQRHIATHTDFAIETTLSGKTYSRWLAQSLSSWRTHLTFVYTRSADENVLRVGKRVLTGGHPVPEIDIRRRYKRSLCNFFRVYRPLVQSWELVDNTDESGNWDFIAQQHPGQPTEIIDRVEWKRLETSYG